MKLQSLIATALVVILGTAILAQNPLEPTKPVTAKIAAPQADLHEKLDVYVARLKHGQVKERREAVDALGHIGERAVAVVPGLVKYLKADEPSTRIYAAKGLWQFKKDPAALAVLIDGLKNKEVQVRASAAEALGGFGLEAKAAVPALVEALHDKTAGFFCYTAALALWRIAKHPDVIPAMIEGLNGDRANRHCAAHVVTEIGVEAKAAVPALLAALKSSDDNIGFHVPGAVALWRIDKNPAGVPALIEHLTDEDPRYDIAALIQIGMEDAKAVAPALREALKHEQVAVRRRAASLLAAIGEDPTDPTVRVSLLIEELKHEKTDVRMGAAYALGALGAKAKAAVPALIEAAKEQTNAEPTPAPGAPKGLLGLEKVVLDIHVGLGIEQLRPGSPAEKAGLKRGDVIKSVNGAKVIDMKQFRAEMAKLPLNPGDKVTFGIQRGDAGPMPITVTVSERPKPGELRVLKGFGASRIAAAKALWKIDKNSAAVHALAAALKDPEEGYYPAGSNMYDLDRSAVWALRSIGAEAKSAVPALIEALKGENVQRRMYAAEALWKIDKNPAAASALVEFLKDRKVTGYDRVYVAKTLWRINKSPAATTALLEFLKEGEDRNVRVAAAEALWQVNRSPAAVPVLIETGSVHALAHIGLETNAAAAALTDALKDEDEGVRNSATRWLKKIDPRAAKKAGLK